MGTANAFDILILPVLQSTAAIFAILGMIQMFQMTLGYFEHQLEVHEPRVDLPRSSQANAYRPMSPRRDRVQPRRVRI